VIDYGRLDAKSSGDFRGGRLRQVGTLSGREVFVGEEEPAGELLR
jgi:hypothetical protein